MVISGIDLFGVEMTSEQSLIKIRERASAE
jgi:hypothetical protein